MKLHIECLQEKLEQYIKEKETLVEEHEEEIRKLQDDHKKDFEKLQNDLKEFETTMTVTVEKLKKAEKERDFALAEVKTEKNKNIQKINYLEKKLQLSI